MGRAATLHRIRSTSPNGFEAPAASPPPSAARREAPGPAAVATILKLGASGVVVAADGFGAVEREAALARIAGYEPQVGDSVLVAETTKGLVVFAVLAGEPRSTLLTAAAGDQTSSPALVAPDGARAELADGALTIRDATGMLIVRYANGAAEIAPERGDLVLRAPVGSVRIDAAVDVEITARRDAVLRADRCSELRAGAPRTSAESISDAAPTGAESVDLASRVSVGPKGVTVAGSVLEAHAKRTRIVTAGADIVARVIRTSATTIETKARKIDVVAERIVERAKEKAADVAGLLETRAGRVRSLVTGAFSLHARRASVKSTEDTSIDGRRVLLG